MSSDPFLDVVAGDMFAKFRSDMAASKARIEDAAETFATLTNHYRDPEPEPEDASLPHPAGYVFICWDHRDYYGPDPVPDPWVFTTLDAAQQRIAALGSGVTAAFEQPDEWHQDSDDCWTAGPFWSVQRVAVHEQVT